MKKKLKKAAEKAAIRGLRKSPIQYDQITIDRPDEGEGEWAIWYWDNVGHGRVFPRPDEFRACKDGPFCLQCALDLGRLKRGEGPE